jgi:hypothetical protein
MDRFYRVQSMPVFQDHINTIIAIIRQLIKAYAIIKRDKEAVWK